MSSRFFGCSIPLLAQCRLFLLRLSMDRLSLPRLVCSILRVGADTVFFGVCMSLEVHRFVSVFMFSLFSFCAQAKPMRDEPVCLCVCFAQTFYLFYLCLSICALTTIRRPAHCLRQRPASPAHEPAIAETKRRILCVGVEAIVKLSFMYFILKFAIFINIFVIDQ